METAVIAATEVVNELIFPPVVFGIIFFIGFAALAFVTYSYRNVANRHRLKSSPGHSAGHH